MAKWLRYRRRTTVQEEAEGSGVSVLREIFTEMTVPDNAACRPVAEQEAWDGIEVYDDGLPEPTLVPTPQDDTDAMLIDHEYRLTLLELGVIE